MKRILILFLVFTVNLVVMAEFPEKKLKNLPIGTFKKARNGTIIQYDKKGKKIGVYKTNNGKYIQVK